MLKYSIITNPANKTTEEFNLEFPLYLKNTMGRMNNSHYLMIIKLEETMESTTIIKETPYKAKPEYTLYKHKHKSINSLFHYFHKDQSYYSYSIFDTEYVKLCQEILDVVKL